MPDNKSSLLDTPFSNAHAVPCADVDEDKECYGYLKPDELLALLKALPDYDKAPPIPDTDAYEEENYSRFKANELVTLMKVLPDYFFLKDRQSHYFACNPRFARLVGLNTPEAIIGLSDDDLPWQFPGHRASFFKAGDQKVLNGQSFRHQIEILMLPDAPPRLMEVSKQPLCNASGVIYGVLGIARDRSVDIRTVASLKKALSQLTDAQKSQHSLVKNISHSLRAPLTGIVGMSDLLVEQTTAEQAALLDIINTASQKLLYQIEQLIAIADQRQGTLTIEPPEMCVTAELFNRLYRLMKPSAQKKKLDFKIIDHTRLPGQLCLTHRTFLSIAIHLIRNAIQYTSTGCITVGCKLDSHYLVLTIKDTSGGLSATEKDYICKPFTVDTPAYQQATGGLGLGLTLVRHVLHDQGGKLSIESESDQGSSFTMYYPVDIPPQPLHDVDNAEKKADSLDVKPFQILVVEDNKLCAIGVEMAFRGSCAHVTVAYTAEKGLTLLETQSFDLIITDLGLPGLSGVEFAERVLKRPSPPPIVALSAHDSPKIKAQCLSVGMQATYLKPFRQADAIALLAHYTSEKIR